MSHPEDFPPAHIRQSVLDNLSAAFPYLDSARTERIARREERAKKRYDPIGSLLPRVKREERINGLTYEARRATHPVGKLRGFRFNFLRRTGKSGLSPVPLARLEGGHPDDKGRDVRAKYHQRKSFAGFSSSELEQLSSLFYLDHSNSNNLLNNPLHPLFQRAQWLTESELPKNKGVIPIYGDSDRFWTADNDEVWRVLEPCCQLASIILQSASAYPWLDALVNDNVRRIPNTDPKYGYLEEFYPRDPILRSQPGEVQKLRKSLVNMAQKLRLAIWSGYTKFSSNLPDADDTTEGQRVTIPATGKFVLCLGIESLQPLLRTDLSQAERMQLSFNVASTLVHEFVHAVGDYVRLERPPTARQSIAEQIWMDEELSELGFSFENTLWGGYPKPYPHGSLLYRGGPGLPKLAVFKSNWFISCHAEYHEENNVYVPRQSDTLDPNDNPFNQIAHWPLPTSWIKNLFDPSLWISVIARGVEVAHMAPVTIGTLLLMNEPRLPGYYRIKHESVFDAPDFTSFGVSIGDSPETVWRKQEELARRQRRDDIRRAIGDDVLEFDNRSDDDFDSEGSETEDDIFEEVYTCPRWNEITQYLFANRAPLQLGLDTMRIISEPTFYRYIREHGVIDLTPREFRDFLGTADARGELFLYSAFPGAGTLMRIEAGWPPPIPHPHQFSPDNPVSYEVVEFLESLVKDRKVRQYVFDHYDETGDIELFYLWAYLDDENDMYDLPEDLFRDALIEYINRGKHDVTFGPEGIVRFVFSPRELSRFRKDNPNPLIEKMIEEWEKRARRLLASWQGSALSPSPQYSPEFSSPSSSDRSFDGPSPLTSPQAPHTGDSDVEMGGNSPRIDLRLDTGTGLRGVKRPRDDDDYGDDDERQSLRPRLGDGGGGGGDDFDMSMADIFR